MSISFSSTVFLICTLIYLLIRTYYIVQNLDNKKTKKKSNSRETVLVSLVTIAQIVLPLMYIFSGLLNFANYHLPMMFTLLGGVIFVLALYVFWRSHADLGAEWSVKLSLNEKHTLISHGVYRSIRHPMYAALFLMAIAQLLLLENLIAGWGALLAFTLLYIIRMPDEEAMMLELFEGDYKKYMQRTGRLIPKIR